MVAGKASCGAPVDDTPLVFVLVGAIGVIGALLLVQLDMETPLHRHKMNARRLIVLFLVLRNMPFVGTMGFGT
jgi:hypothetical protein